MPLMGSGGCCPEPVSPRAEPCRKAKLVWCYCTVAIVASVALAVVIFCLLHRSVDAYPLVIYGTDKPDVQLWQTFCEARDIKFTMAVFPLFYQLADDPLKDIHDWLAAFAAEESIRWIDLLSLFAGKDERDYWVHSRDVHPNTYAHQEASNFLYETVNW